jgi:hypothetical protein
VRDPFQKSTHPNGKGKATRELAQRQWQTISTRKLPRRKNGHRRIFSFHRENGHAQSNSMHAEAQKELFPYLTQPPEAALRLRSTPGKPLTKRQKQFTKLLRRLEALRAEYDRSVACWEEFLDLYVREIRPAELALNGHRIAFIDLLAQAWQGKNRLGRRQRATLAEVIERELGEVVVLQPDLPGAHERLDEIADLLSKAREKAREASQVAFCRELQRVGTEADGTLDPQLREHFEDLGLDISRFAPGMTAEELAAEIDRQMRELHDGQADEEMEAEAFWEPPPEASGRKPTAARKRAAAKAAEREKARQRTLSTIYKQLAKVIHPDLEQDPARRAEKERVMQELTAAHRNRDLHALLRLELAWLEGENDRLDALTDEKLGLYLDVLREQVDEAEANLFGVAEEPRFQAVWRFRHPFASLPRDRAEILSEIGEESRVLATLVERLQGDGTKDFLRRIVANEHERQRYARSFPGFAVRF